MFGMALALMPIVLPNGPIELPADVIEVHALSFTMPIQVGPKTGELDEILLFASTNFGKSWRKEASCKPTERKIVFTAPRDGIYCFAIQAVNKDGTRTPPSEKELVSEVKVFVNSAQKQTKRKEVRSEGKQFDLVSMEFRKGAPELSIAAGSALRFLIRQPGKHITSIDFDGSEITIKDNLGSDIAPNQLRRNVFVHSADAFKDPGLVSFQVFSGILPSRGAISLKVSGFITLNIAKEEKVITQKGLKLKIGEELKVGPVHFSRIPAPGITINGKSLPNGNDRIQAAFFKNVIKIIEFFDADGKPLPAKQVGGSCFGFYDHAQITQGYSVNGSIDNVTVQVTYYSKTEALRVPLDLTVGIGY